MSKLSDVAIRNAKAREAVYRLGDDRVAGLALEVRPSGGKFWRFRFPHRTSDGKASASMMSLGEYPTVSLAEAREKATKARVQVHEGKNPVQQKHKERARNVQLGANTVEALARDMIAGKAAWSEKYRARFLHYFEVDVFPAIGRMAITDVTPADVLVILRKVEKRSPVAASYLCGRIGSVFRYAIINQRATYDPTQPLRGVIERKPHKHKEPLNVGQYVASARRYSNPVIGAAMELLLLLACRPIELRNMEWAEVDLKEAVWRIPAEKMKMRRPHAAPLSKRAVALLRKLPRFEHSPYVFPSYKHSAGPINAETIPRAMEILGVDGSPHAVRATFSTWAHERGYPTHVIESALAHKDTNTVRASYNAATYMPQRRELAEAWARHVESEARRAKVDAARETI